jgi:ubiquinone/menaquinone biosynthesis C-methylase UbiE
LKSSDSISDPHSYYETYWSEDGFCPHGKTWPELNALMKEFTSPNTRCLDVGCGDGRTIGVWLRDNNREYVGVDISEHALLAARNVGLTVLKLNDATSLPIQDSCINAAFAIEVFEHFFAPQAVAAEILRVLQPGGVLIATVPNVSYWRRRLDLAVLGRWNPVGDELSVEQPWRDPHISFFAPRNLEQMLRQVGFTDVQVGAHGGGLLRDLPVLRRLWRGRPSSSYLRAQTGWPSLLGYRVHAIARKGISSAEGA